MQILDAIDSTGWCTDGRVSALNSYENRVYSVGMENGETLIAKFYRPGRWSDETILEEHAFCDALVDHDLPVIAPLKDSRGQSLHRHGPFRFCLFNRAGGRSPELDNPEQLAVIGRTIGRLHLVADTFQFDHRPFIDAFRLGDDSADYLLESDALPLEQARVYESVIDDLLPEVHDRLDAVDYREICLHGDFHPGNILWGSDGTPHLLDFDDTATGPATQDLWMFISGEREYAQARLGDLLDGYHEFRDFDERELALIEPLRTLRIIHYAAWIARRWEDPAFVQAFPFFAEARFWDEHIQSLREQRAALDEPALIY
ncbi:MAG: serine/threonine protein kinase [Granulosicoccus sp.]|nr:serine/threonine protein kinase [Granulosicoccus sp.]